MFTLQTLKDRWSAIKANPKVQKFVEIAQRIFGFMILRLQEPSSWRGITLAMSAIGGYTFGDDPNKALAFVGIGMLVAGVIGMIFPDAVKKAEEVNHGRSGGFGGFGSFGHGQGNQVIDTPDDDDVAPPASQRAPR